MRYKRGKCYCLWEVKQCFTHTHTTLLLWTDGITDIPVCKCYFNSKFQQLIVTYAYRLRDNWHLNTSMCQMVHKLLPCIFYMFLASTRKKSSFRDVAPCLSYKTEYQRQNQTVTCFALIRNSIIYSQLLLIKCYVIWEVKKKIRLYSQGGKISRP